MMQMYAWATMLVDYSKEDGLLKATQDTFSGEKPCALCCKIKNAEKDTPNNRVPAAPTSPLSAKLLQEMLPVQTITLTPPPAIRTSPVTFTDICLPAGIGPLSPPVPPPDHLV